MFRFTVSGGTDSRRMRPGEFLYPLSVTHDDFGVRRLVLLWFRPSTQSPRYPGLISRSYTWTIRRGPPTRPDTESQSESGESPWGEEKDVELERC